MCKLKGNVTTLNTVGKAITEDLLENVNTKTAIAINEEMLDIHKTLPGKRTLANEGDETEVGICSTEGNTNFYDTSCASGA